MKVLLIGEYSGVHTNLAKALKQKNINVCTVHDGDSYKKFEPDVVIKYNRLESKNKYINFILKLYYQLLLYLGLSGCLQIFKYRNEISKLKGYDVVQIINPVFLSSFGSIVNIIVLKYLLRHNKKMFMCALGDDYIWVKGSLENKKFKSMFHLMTLRNFRQYLHSMMYVYGFLYPYLNRLVVKKANRIIPGLYDYYYYYKNYSNCNEIVPIPIEMDAEVQPLKFKDYPINIFHGWQPNKEYRKGNLFFDEAVKKLIINYPDKVNYQIVGGLPYKEYIKTFNKSHIFLDQCMSMDQGVNALLALAKGKVVFSGFDDYLCGYYSLKNKPLLDSKPDIEFIYKQLETLIVNPYLLDNYSERAILFMKSNHNFNYVLEKYLKIWEKF